MLLAGGRGSRLGIGAPKALATLGGESLLERALTLLGSGCSTVVVVAPRAMALPVDASRRVDDPAGERGPLAALVAGLAVRPHAGALVLGVDFPLARRALLELLVERLGDRAGVIPAPGGVPQPLLAAYGPAAHDRLAGRLEAGERSVTAAALALDPLVLDDAALDAAGVEPVQFLNVNTPEDLTRAERLLARGAGPRS